MVFFFLLRIVSGGPIQIGPPHNIHFFVWASKNFGGHFQNRTLIFKAFYDCFSRPKIEKGFHVKYDLFNTNSWDKKMTHFNYLPLLIANSLPLIMWCSKFFISNGLRLRRCSEASSPSQIKVLDNSLAITWMIKPTRNLNISWNNWGSVLMNIAK